MPSKDPRRALLDIQDHIALVREFTMGFDEQSFVEDKKTVYSVVRCLEIISEALRRLPDALKARHPGVPWKKMAGAGNVYRHDYEGIAAIISGILSRRRLLSCKT